MAFSDISKAVGWDRGVLDVYPTLEQVDEAVKANNGYLILSWNRFLRSPENDVEIEIIKRIVDGLGKASAELDKE